MSKSKDKKIKYTELEHMLKNELNSDNSLSKNAPIDSKPKCIPKKEPTDRKSNRVVKDGPTDSKSKHISKKEPTDRKSNRVVKDGPIDSKSKHISKKEPTDRKSNRVVKDGPIDSKSKHNFFSLPFMSACETAKRSGNINNLIMSTCCGAIHKKLKEECKNYFEYNNNYIDSCVNFIDLLNQNRLLNKGSHTSNIDTHKKDDIVFSFEKLKKDGAQFGAYLWGNDSMPKKLRDFYGENLTSKFIALWNVFPDGPIVCQLFDILFTKIKGSELFDNLKDETTKEQYNKLRDQLVRHKKLLNDIYVHIKKLDKEIEKNN